MPNLLIKIPHGSFPGAAREALFKAVTEVAHSVEQMGDAPQQRAITWVVIEELASGGLRCGGADLTSRMLPCIVQAYVPGGVLDGAARAAYVAGLSRAFEQSRPAGDARPVRLSTLLLEVPEGQWGADDAIWRLPEVAAAAGFRHLQTVASSSVVAGSAAAG